MHNCCHYDEGYDEGYYDGQNESEFVRKASQDFERLEAIIQESYDILLEVEKCHLLDPFILGDELGFKISKFLSENQNATNNY